MSDPGTNPFARYAPPATGAVPADSAANPFAKFAGPAASTAPKDVKGNAFETFMRGVANGATFNLADPIAAAGDAALPAVGDLLDPVAPSHAASFGQRYDENLASLERGLSTDQKEHPIASVGGNIAGGLVNPVTRALPVAKTMGGAVGIGAGTGALYGAGDAISKQDDALHSFEDTALNSFLGGTIGGALHGAGSLIQPAEKSGAADFLNNEGVPTTIGQSLGGTAQRLEDSSTSVPILGDAIRDQQRQGITEFNRAGYNRVLQPLGLTYGKDAPVGNEGIQKLGELIGNAYDHAFDGAVVKNDQPFNDGVSQAIDDASHVLTSDRLQMLTKNVNRLVTSKFDDNGELGGDALIQAKNWLAQQARPSAMATIDERNLSSAYGDVLSALKDDITANDPDRGSMLNAADNAYMRFLRVAHAASSSNASAKEGVFTPNQLSTSIRSLENSSGKMAFAKGVSPLQDLAQAGQQALSSTVPDSGTAIRTMFQHPVSSVATLPIWLAGQGAYTNAGQHLAHAIAFGAPAARKAIAGIPSAVAPAAYGLLGEQASEPGEP